VLLLKEPILVQRDPLEALQSKKVKNIKTDRPSSKKKNNRSKGKDLPEQSLAG
jgi:hypothetical protein